MPKLGARRYLSVVMRFTTYCLVTLLAGFLGCGRDQSAERAAVPDTARAHESSGVVASRDTAAISEAPGHGGQSGSAAAAVSVVRDYFAAINSRNYQRAYAAWEGGGEASGQSFAAFRDGFSNTDSVTISVGAPSRIEGAAGSRYVNVPVRVTIRHRDGAVEHARRTYVLRRAVVPGASPAQRRWHIYSSQVAAP
jgi:hypothetical protein